MSLTLTTYLVTIIDHFWVFCFISPTYLGSCTQLFSLHLIIPYSSLNVTSALPAAPARAASHLNLVASLQRIILPRQTFYPARLRRWSIKYPSTLAGVNAQLPATGLYGVVLGEGRGWHGEHLDPARCQGLGNHYVTGG